MSLALRLRTDGEPAQVHFYWTTTQAPDYSEERKIVIPVVADSLWATYETVLDHPAWTGTVTGLRLTVPYLSDADGAGTAIDWLRLK